MLRFSVPSEGSPPESVDLAGAYLVGSDGVPLRAALEQRNGEILCTKRSSGPAALAVLWPVPGMGRILLETTRLPERDKPYLLPLELLRGQLMRMVHKLEEWQQYDPLAGAHDQPVVRECLATMTEALKADGAEQATRIAQQGLGRAVAAGEDMVLRLAKDIYARRRRQPHLAPRRPFGCAVDLANGDDSYRNRLAKAFDFATLPFSWQDIQPAEQEFRWEPLDGWVEWLTRKRIPIRGSSVVAFTEQHVPPWLYVWEHDYETLRDLVYEHIRRVVGRYGSRIAVWDIISGVHANNCLSFNFEQLMELTRMAVAVTKQLSPRSIVNIDLTDPWGEYYARNQRTIPPLLYADMAIQSGINFDGLGLQFQFGRGVDGEFVRDFFQISCLLDRFSSLGKPLHVTAVQVPSAANGSKDKSAPDGGEWRDPWSEAIQSRWLHSFCELALSKPMVESVTWRELADRGGQVAAHGGLLRKDLSPKPAYETVLSMRADLLANGRSGRVFAAGRSIRT